MSVCETVFLLSSLSDRIFIYSVVIAIFLLVLLVSCIFYYIKCNKNKYFKSVEKCKHYQIVYHRQTKVMYSVSRLGVFTVLVNEDGSPKIYND